MLGVGQSWSFTQVSILHLLVGVGGSRSVLGPSLSFRSRRDRGPPAVELGAGYFSYLLVQSVLRENASKIPQRSLTLQNGSFHGIRIPSPTHAFAGKRSGIIRASSEIDGKEESKPDPLPPSRGPEGAALPVENLPLESKLKESMEQKLRMKLAKKIRLRRKRLLRKRRMRKKGR